MISLGKKMSMVMKNMTRFIQAKGPIQDEQGLIKSASKLSILAIQMKNLGTPILQQCDEKYLKQQMQAVLGQIEPIQHQLKSLTKVYASAEEYVCAESINSLIQNAKNLLQVVLEVVRCSVACTIRKACVGYSSGPNSLRRFSSTASVDITRRRKLLFDSEFNQFKIDFS